MAEAYWYVAHTYSGYENKVMESIRKTVENRGMGDQILEVRVPLQDVEEEKNGVKKTVPRKLFPGYVLVKMIMSDDAWYVVRNTRGVTGFVGPGSAPTPLTETEMFNLGVMSGDVKAEFEVGDIITVVAGAWEGKVCAVQAVNQSKQCVTINVELLSRETPVEISFKDVRKK